MKILLVSPLPPPNGGMATWTEQYLSNCTDQNEVYLVDTAFIGNRSSLNGKRINLFTELKRMFVILKKYTDILKNKDIDVIHINSACTTTGIIRDAICVFLRKKKPIVFHCHCNIQDKLKGKLARCLGKYIFNVVDCVLVLNKKSYEFVSTISTNKLLIMPNSIDDVSFIETYNVSDDLKNIIYVGHVKKEKGIKEIIEAAKILKDINFHIIGPINAEIEEIDKPDNMIFYGRMDRDEVIKKMYESDAMLFPSYTEGFSMVMLEAMSVGLPIVASNVGANEDMIEDKGGIIVSPKSYQEIINAIDSIQEQTIRLGMSKWNRDKVKQNYTNTIVYNLLQEVYNEIGI